MGLFAAVVVPVVIIASSFLCSSRYCCFSHCLCLCPVPNQLPGVRAAVAAAASCLTNLHKQRRIQTHTHTLARSSGRETRTHTGAEQVLFEGFFFLLLAGLLRVFFFVAIFVVFFSSVLFCCYCLHVAVGARELRCVAVATK